MFVKLVETKCLKSEDEEFDAMKHINMLCNDDCVKNEKWISMENERVKLKKRNEIYNGCMQSLKKKNAVNIKEINVLRDRLETTQNDHQRLNAEKQELLVKNRTLSNENKSYRMKMDNVEMRFREISAEAKKKENLKNMDEINKLNQKLKCIKNENESFKSEAMRCNQEMNLLKKQYLNNIEQTNELKEEIKSLKQYNLWNIDGLNEEKLNELESKMMHNMKIIKERRERLMDDKLRCIICLENAKNIVILGCNHFDICNECEMNLQPKVCPRCQNTFTNVIRLNNL